jgi:hypothetical protein
MSMPLPKAQLEAIRNYTLGGYVAINGDLRGDGYGGEAIQRHILALDEALDAALSVEPLVLYRGVDSIYATELDKRGLKAGDIIEDLAFQSTSRNRSICRGFMGYDAGGLLFRIAVPKGSKVLDLSPYSTNPAEEEFLLPRDTQLRVVGYDENEDVLDVEVIHRG